jgi:hypothetical protein
MTQPRTYIRVTWVAQVYDKPVVTAHTWDDLVAGVDDYYGIGKDPKAKKIRYTPNDSQYVESFDGYFEYEVDDFNGGIELERVNVYCVDFYPHTKYQEGTTWEEEAPQAIDEWEDDYGTDDDDDE